MNNLLSNIKIKVARYNLGVLGNFVINYVDETEFKRQRIALLKNVVLPGMDLTMDDIKEYFILEGIKSFIPIADTIPFEDVLKSIDDIKKHLRIVEDEKSNIAKIRESFDYLDIDLSDAEIIELNNFIKTFI